MTKNDNSIAIGHGAIAVGNSIAIGNKAYAGGGEPPHQILFDIRHFIAEAGEKDLSLQLNDTVLLPFANDSLDKDKAISFLNDLLLNPKLTGILDLVNKGIEFIKNIAD